VPAIAGEAAAVPVLTRCTPKPVPTRSSSPRSSSDHTDGETSAIGRSGGPLAASARVAAA
jgi:hypothetical protein